MCVYVFVMCVCRSISYFIVYLHFLSAVIIHDLPHRNLFTIEFSDHLMQPWIKFDPRVREDSYEQLVMLE